MRDSDWSHDHFLDNAKTWLSEAVLHKLSRQVGGAVRKAQRTIENAHGEQPFKEVFAAADALLFQLRQALSSLNHCDGQRSDSSIGEQSFRADNRVVHTNVDTTSVHELLPYDAQHVEDMVQDRLRCIAPVLEQQIRAALDLPSVKVPVEDKRRRNIAAHPRAKNANLVVSEISAQDLSAIERGYRDAGTAGMQHVDSFNARFQEALQIVAEREARPADHARQEQTTLPSAAAVPFVPLAMSNVSPPQHLESDTARHQGDSHIVDFYAIGDCEDKACQTECLDKSACAQSQDSMLNHVLTAIPARCDPKCAALLEELSSKVEALSTFLQGYAFTPVGITVSMDNTCEKGDGTKGVEAAKAACDKGSLLANASGAVGLENDDLAKAVPGRDPVLTESEEPACDKGVPDSCEVPCAKAGCNLLQMPKHEIELLDDGCVNDPFYIDGLADDFSDAIDLLDNRESTTCDKEVPEHIRVLAFDSSWEGDCAGDKGITYTTDACDKGGAHTTAGGSISDTAINKRDVDHISLQPSITHNRWTELIDTDAEQELDELHIVPASSEPDILQNSPVTSLVYGPKEGVQSDSKNDQQIDSASPVASKTD